MSGDEPPSAPPWESFTMLRYCTGTVIFVIFVIFVGDAVTVNPENRAQRKCQRVHKR